MKLSELISILQEKLEIHGDISVTTFDLDRHICPITEIEFSEYPYKNIYVG